MKFFTKASLCVAGVVLSSLNLGIAPAAAGTMHNGWDYAIDSFNDGFSGNTSGSNSAYEFYGLAVRETADQIYVAINANLGLEGKASNGAENGTISYGDLFFNFSGQNLDDANGSLYAIRFASSNDSGVSELGVYSNVTGKNVAGINNGFSSMSAHANKAGSNASMGDLSESDSYFQQGGNAVSNSIDSGTQVGDISMLDGSALGSLGLDFGHFNATGSKTIGFSFDRALFPDGDFTAHLFAECINDGVAISSTFEPVEPPTSESVPEPASTFGLLMLGGLGLLKRRERAA
ncbi:MAG: PEP-CTERM sorting domain-containing protein [Cyanobacteria bacterium SID2]|nr:PEP-CTERM sorting domain-containing protein [Cyanobacteria bacterium SID2]MBP0002684.1 PEP-CTERM sorting domain-containing protein [Cyanobacteria bacterium SBC]